MADADTSKVAGEQQETVETVDSLKARLAEMDTTIKALSDESTKHKNLRRQAEKERDELKKAKPTQSSEEDYKSLWQQTTEKLSKTLERTKSSDIRTALSEQLTKSRVASDRFDAAIGLIDRALIEWDEDAGVDPHSVTAAVQKLKAQHAFLFETTVSPTDVKTPGDGGVKNSITRAAFDALSPKEKMEKMKAKVRLTD